MAPITNAQFNAACAAIPAPYGPFTRVSNLETGVVDPNADIQFTVTTAPGDTLLISYNQLLNPRVAVDMAKDAAGFHAKAEILATLGKGLGSALAAVDPFDFTAKDFTRFVALFQAVREITNMVPNLPWFEDGDDKDLLTAAFTENAGDPTVVFTNTSTGLRSFTMWSFGDGEISFEESPTHTYAVNGTYTVTLIVASHQGVRYATDSIVIDSYA